jgi:TRAP-type transport system small permease protein
VTVTATFREDSMNRNHLATALGVLRHAEMIVACMAFLLMLAVVVINVAARYLFATSLVYTEELAYLGFTWSVFMGMSYLYRQRALIAVDFVYDVLPAAWQRTVTLTTMVGLIGANGYFTWLAWILTSGGWIRRSPYLEIPYFFINLAAVIAFAVMTGASVYFLYRLLRHEAIAEIALENMQ